MIAINQAIESIVSGCAVSCGALVAVAGAGKLYRGMRRLDDRTAIRRALRVPQRRWRLVELAAGGTECVAGAIVCSGAYPLLGGASLAGLGAVFCAVLGYARIKQVPGGCGCIRWRTAADPAAEAVTWRAMARGGLLFGVGVAYLVLCADPANAPSRSWFAGGVAAGSAVLVLLSMPWPARSPVCRRPVWRGTRTTLRALARHQVFAAMARSAGPFGPVAWYRRAGCTDEFWFTALAGQDGTSVVFRVRRAAPGARLAVHAALRDVPPPGPGRPARAVSVAGAATAAPREPGDGEYLQPATRPALTAAGKAPAGPAPGDGLRAGDRGGSSSQAGESSADGGRRYEVSASP